MRCISSLCLSVYFSCTTAGEPLHQSLQEAWEAVSGVDAGKPKMWLNFEAPFAELPPIFMPPVPELGVCNGPEPQLGEYAAGEKSVISSALGEVSYVRAWLKRCSALQWLHPGGRHHGPATQW